MKHILNTAVRMAELETNPFIARVDIALALNINDPKHFLAAREKMQSIQNARATFFELKAAHEKLRKSGDPLAKSPALERQLSQYAQAFNPHISAKAYRAIA